MYQMLHPTSQKTEVLNDKLNTVLSIVILKIIISAPNFTKFWNLEKILLHLFTHIDI